MCAADPDEVNDLGAEEDVAQDDAIKGIEETKDEVPQDEEGSQL